MKPFKLITKEPGEKFPPSIVLLDFKKEVVATIWADGRITPSEQQQDYEFEEVKYFLNISKNFFTFYNNLREKDKEIEEMKLNQIPTIVRQ